MTSKEALNDIIDELKWCCNNGKTLREYDETRVKVIEKDLDVLNVLEKHPLIRLENIYDYDSYNNYIDSDVSGENLTEKEWNILKDWQMKAIGNGWH